MSTITTHTGAKRKKATKTSIRKNYGPERMTIKIKFPSGGTLRFMNSYASMRLEIGFSNDEETLKRQHTIMQNWLKLKKGETVGQLFDRLEAAALRCTSGAELVSLATLLLNK